MANTERSKKRDVAESVAVAYILFMLVKLLVRLAIGLAVTAYWLVALVVWLGFVLILSINRPMTIALGDVDAKFKMAKVTTALVASWTGPLKRDLGRTNDLISPETGIRNPRTGRPARNSLAAPLIKTTCQEYERKLADQSDQMIDTSFDFRTESGGKDPDAYSVTLCRYHKLLWSRVLPSGSLFDLEVSRRHGAYALDHRSELGEFSLTSDTIIHSYTRWEKLRHITKFFPEEENEAFRTIGSTIGGRLVFPGNQIDRKQTINGARGCHWKIRDRFDLTLECIRRHYIGQDSPLEDTLKRYGDFFALFEDFRGYVQFFMLQDLVLDDYSAVKFLMPFDDFRTSPVPGDVDTYREYRRLSIEFVKARNRRIDRHTASLHCQAPQQMRLTTPTIARPRRAKLKLPPQQPVAPAVPQVTVEMQRRVVDLMGDHGVVWLENDKYCIGVPTTQYLKKDLARWKKWVSSDNVRWASNANFEAALKYASSPRSRAARASAAARKAAR